MKFDFPKIEEYGNFPMILAAAHVGMVTCRPSIAISENTTELLYETDSGMETTRCIGLTEMALSVLQEAEGKWVTCTFAQGRAEMMVIPLENRLRFRGIILGGVRKNIAMHPIGIDNDRNIVYFEVDDV